MDRRNFLKFLGVAPAAVVPAAVVAATAPAVPVEDPAEIARLKELLAFEDALRKAEHRALVSVVESPWDCRRVIAMSLNSSGDHPMVAQIQKELGR